MVIYERQMVVNQCILNILDDRVDHNRKNQTKSFWMMSTRI